MTSKIESRIHETQKSSHLVTGHLLRAAVAVILAPACSPVPPDAIIACSVDGGALASGYVASQNTDGHYVCLPFSQPSVASHCPYVVERGGVFWLVNFTPAQAYTRRYPVGCRDVLQGFQRPCRTIQLIYNAVPAPLGEIDSGVILNGWHYTDDGPAQLVWVYTPECAPGPRPSQGAQISMPDRSSSPSLLNDSGCEIDASEGISAYGEFNDAGVCQLYPNQRCDAGMGINAFYASDGACTPYWGTPCDSGTTMNSHYARDGACLPNPGERCDAGRGTPGQILLDGGCGTIDAGAR